MDAISVSAHHGCANRENQLLPTLNLLHQHPEIGMIEIDFVYHNKQFISSHDYSEENISLGSTLEEWIVAMIPLGKILWIDIKDTIASIPSADFIRFNVAKFYKHLERLEDKHPDLKHYILLSCQYINVLNRLVEMNHGYTIIHDVPGDYAYILYELFPLSMIKSYVHYRMMKYLKDKSGIVCIDHIFFESFEELYEFILNLTQKVIVVYSYETFDSGKHTIPGKHVIYQYNYIL